MFAFVVIAFSIFCAGPMYNEGGQKAFLEKGETAAVKQAWAEKEPLDYSKLND